jgi:hypothetical protein
LVIDEVRPLVLRGFLGVIFGVNTGVSWSRRPLERVHLFVGESDAVFSFAGIDDLESV